ncbi:MULTISPECIES: hypothetical protein [unclassified Variovorax]|uniref:hypothetical protein n=1 Tax=unclassified Variovorax TaxID=663243 RepID=UPI003F453E34
MFDTKLPGGASGMFRPQPFFGALVVESDPAVASRLNSVLGVLAPGRCVVFVPAREEADAMLATLSFDLVFVETLTVPICADAFRKLELRSPTPAIPEGTRHGLPG